MKEKRGFTLIELLAVIVILAVIAIIATPIVLNMINNAKKKAAISGAYGYVDAIEYSNGLADYDSNYTKILDGTYKVSDITNLKLKGKIPTYGDVVIEASVVKEANLCINGYYITYRNKNAEATGKCSGVSDDTPPVISMGEIKTTAGSVEINFLATDPESGIKEASCKLTIDDTELTGNVTNVGDNEYVCKVSGLTKEKTYSYNITATNSKNKTSEPKTGNVETVNFQSIVITKEPVESQWAETRTITLSGNMDGETLEYQIGESVDETKWKPYSSPFTINENTNVYVRLTDGINVSDSETYNENRIDTTAPDLTLGEATATPTTITIPITVNRDEQSSIKSTTCQTTSPIVITGTANSGRTSCTISGLDVTTTYSYSVTTTNRANIPTTQTGSTTTIGITSEEVKYDDTRTRLGCGDAQCAVQRLEELYN